jgi:putative transcriptional regulator
MPEFSDNGAKVSRVYSLYRMSRTLYIGPMPEAVLTNKVKIRRVMADLTQEELAVRVGVTRQTILAIEKGNYAPSVVLALRLGRTLHCTVEELFDESTD